MLTILAVLIFAIAGLVFYASTKPDDFHVERSVHITAQAADIHPHLNDFHAWNAWTPYTKDPNMKQTYSAEKGACVGKGAKYGWEGNKQVGQGEITILDSLPERLTMDLHMMKPFKARNLASFLLDSSGANHTRVTWCLDGKNTLISKVMGLFFSMDKMVGADFEVGLAKLKAVVEG